MANGQLKLFKDTQANFDALNNGTDKKISDGNLIVAKNNTSSTGNLYIDYNNDTRIKLSDDNAYVGGEYNEEGVLTLSKMNGTREDILSVDSKLSETSINPIQNKVVNAKFKEQTQQMGKIEETLNEKAEIEPISQDEYDSRLAEGTLDPEIVYFINDTDGYIDATVNMVDLENRVIGLENNKVTSANQITYSNASSGLTATNIQSAIDELDMKTDSSYSASFIAEYGVTPFSEIRNAISAGKSVVVRYNCNVGGINGVVYGELKSYNSATATFSAIAYDTSYEFFCDIASGWFINIKPEKTKLSEFTNDANYAKYKYFNFIEVGVNIEGNPTYDEIKEAVENGYIPFLKYRKDGVAHMTISNCGPNDDQNEGQFTFIASNSRADMGWVMEVNEFWCYLQDDGSTLWRSGTHYSDAFVAEYNVTPVEAVLDAYEKGLEIIVKRSATPSNPAHYARLVRADGYGVTPNLTFTCEENRLSHHYHINGEGWHYWYYDLEQKLFIAEYGVTKYSEILSAYKAGKTITLYVPTGTIIITINKEETFLPLSYAEGSGDARNFVFTTTNNEQILHCMVSTDDVWKHYVNDLRAQFGGITQSINNLNFRMDGINDNITTLLKNITQYKMEKIPPNGKFYLREKGLYVAIGYDYSLALYDQDGNLLGNDNNLICGVICTERINNEGLFSAFYVKTYKKALVATPESAPLYLSNKAYILNKNTNQPVAVFCVKAQEV